MVISPYDRLKFTGLRVPQAQLVGPPVTTKQPTAPSWAGAVIQSAALVKTQTPHAN